MKPVRFGRVGTPYEGVTATIEVVTKRKVQVSFNQIVPVNGLKLGGQVFKHFLIMENN